MKKLTRALPVLLLVTMIATMLTMSICAQGVWPSTAQVVTTEGGVRLMVDDKVMIPVLSYGYAGENDYYKYYRTIEYSKHSQNLVYMISMGNDWTSESTRESWDENITRLLELDPDAYFIFRVSAMAGGEWTSQNNLFTDTEGEYAKRYDGSNSGQDIGLGWFSLASQNWRDRIEYNYTEGLQWLATRPYADRIIGFQCGNATTFEWVFVTFANGNLDDYSEASRDGFRAWLKEKYKTNAKLQAAWDNKEVTFDTAEIPTPEERFTTNDGLFHNTFTGSSSVVDYNTYYNWCYYDAMEHIGKIIHEKSDDSLLAGFLYGYYFSYVQVAYPVNTGAYDMTDLMQSENIDFLSATNFYGNTRALGSSQISTMVIDSLTANNKLYIMEDDNRTHISNAADNEWHAKSYDETVAIIRRNFSLSAVRDQGLYFMDMDGSGWYNDSDVWEQISELRRLWAAMNYQSVDGGYQPDIALIVDDESIFYTDTDDSRVSIYTLNQLNELLDSGMTYGTYMKCDLDKLPSSVDIIIMANTFYMDKQDITNINAHKADGKVIIWCRAPGYITEESQSVDNITDLIGIKMAMVESVDNEMTRITNETHPITATAFVTQFGKMGKSRTTFYVDDPEAETLGVYKGTEYSSFAIKELDGWVSIFSGTGAVRGELIQAIAKLYTDIHNYKPEGQNARDGLETDGTYMCYNPASMGHKVILLPEYSHVVDNVNNVNKGNSVNAITYDAAFKGDVGLFSIIPGDYREVSVDSAEVTKTGEWKTIDGGLESTTPGDTLTYTFKGTFVSIIASRGYDKGTIGYTIDGVEYPDINFHTKEGLDGKNCEYVLAQNLADTEHTVVVTVKEPVEYAPYVLDLSSGTPEYNSIYGNEVPSHLKSSNGADDPPYEMGVEFKTKVPGRVLKARLLACPRESGKHTVTMFDGSGRIIAGPFDWNVKVTETSWVEYTFIEPIEIEAEKTYILSIANVTGENHYIGDAQFFYDNDPKSVFLLTSVSGRFGTAMGKCPTLHYNGTSYGRDLVFQYDAEVAKPEEVVHVDKNIVINGFGTVDSSNIVKVSQEDRLAVEKSYETEEFAVVKEIGSMGSVNTAPAGITAKSTKSTVLVNGVETQFEAYEIDGYNYFKLRDFAYAVNGSAKQFEVTWDEAANAIGLISGSAYTAAGGELTLGDGADKKAEKTTSAVIKDGVEVSFEAYEIGGYNYFKLRDMAAAFNIGITWDDATSTIGIDTTIDYVAP